MARSNGNNNNRQQSGELKRSYSFTAIFEYDEDGISVIFPDFPGALTCGNNEEEAYRNAKEALGLHLFELEQDNNIIPEPTRLFQQSLGPNQAAVIVNVFMPLIRDRVKRATVKKTLTIPKWLNDIAEENKINFSHVLQESLKERLGIKLGKQDHDLY
jgi:predicted RNase H-like HicB family nuclease